MDIFWLIAGLLMIIWGASWLTDGASSIARRSGISDLTVGLTVVAFGTSAPELVISVVSAIKGNPELAVGNVVGSNIFNILAIIGITALVRPIKVERTILTNEIPFVVLTSLLLLTMGNAPLLDHGMSAVITRVDGIVLLLVFAVFMRYTLAQAKNGATNADEAELKAPMTVWRSIIWVVVGLAGLVFGGDRFVAGASGIASGLGVSDAVIGLTIVSAGTSLPELATSVAAALKGKPAIAVGNVIGSCIFNILMILGVSATVRPLTLGNIGNFDLLTLAGASLLFWLFGWKIRERTITRGEGAVLAAGYIAYVCLLVAKAV